MSFLSLTNIFYICARLQNKHNKLARVRDTYTHLAIWTNAQMKPRLEELF